MLTIGDFSRLSHVTPRMLRHYDAMGLLRPQAVGENGYRYYRQEQLAELVKIQWLKDYGFSLAEIGPMLDMKDAQLLPYLQQRWQVLRAELEEKRNAIARIEADISRMEGKKMMENQYHVILLDEPEQKVFSIRRTVGVDQYHALFCELRSEAEGLGLKQAGPIQMLYYDADFDPSSADVEVQMVVAQTGPGVRIKPGCLCAAVQHRGSYENLHLAYGALCAWLAEHTEYRVCGPAMDRYLNDPHDTPPEQLETGVLFPVERVPA